MHAMMKLSYSCDVSYYVFIIIFCVVLFIFVLYVFVCVCPCAEYVQTQHIFVVIVGIWVSKG